VIAPAEYSTQDRNLDYITKYSRAAVLSMDRIGVPASTSYWRRAFWKVRRGTSELATTAKNHFGVKCGGNWNGKTYKKKDDDRDKDGNIIESCFRSYESVEESFVDHGQFLRDPRKSHPLWLSVQPSTVPITKPGPADCNRQGMPRPPDYADKLIGLIDRYKLYEYDSPGSRPNTFPTEGQW
jgi:flagellum-specific peptidoglycan hydrolase FlgJ